MVLVVSPLKPQKKVSFRRPARKPAPVPYEIVIPAPSSNVLRRFLSLDNARALRKLHKTYGAVFWSHNSKIKLAGESALPDVQEKLAEIVRALLSGIQAGNPLTPRQLDDLIYGEKSSVVAPMTRANIYVRDGDNVSRKKKLHGFFQEHGELVRAVGAIFDADLTPDKDFSLVVTAKDGEVDDEELRQRQSVTIMQALVRREQDQGNITLKDVMTLAYGITKGDRNAFSIQKRLRHLKENGLPPIVEQPQPAVKPIVKAPEKPAEEHKPARAPVSFSKPKDDDASETQKEYRHKPARKKKSLSLTTLRILRRHAWTAAHIRNQADTNEKAPARRIRSTGKEKAIPKFSGVPPVTVEGYIIGEDASCLLSVSRDETTGTVRVDHTLFAPLLQNKVDLVFDRRFMEETRSVNADPYVACKAYDEAVKKLFGAEELQQPYFTDSMVKPGLTFRYIYHPDYPERGFTKEILPSFARAAGVVPYVLANMHFDANLSDKIKKVIPGYACIEQTYKLFKSQQMITGLSPQTNFGCVMAACDALSVCTARQTIFDKNLEALHHVAKSDYPRADFEPHIGYVSTSVAIGKKIRLDACQPFIRGDKSVSLINRSVLRLYHADGEEMLSPDLAKRMARIHHYQSMLAIKPDYLSARAPIDTHSIIQNILPDYQKPRTKTFRYDAKSPT